MPVPEEIRRVKRPVNTVVVESGCKGCRQYAVRERACTIYVPGSNPQPRNGKVIGHIWEGQYVPVSSETTEITPVMLSYGSSALVNSVLKDVYEDLLCVFQLNDAVRIMAIAALKVIRPSISCNRLSTHYNRTFISIFYPHAGLSRNTVSAFLQRLGQAGTLRQNFYLRRMSAVAKEHHIAIDGMLKQNSSSVNDLSRFSYKSRIKGCKDISLLYAYDIEIQEPICAEVFPGNSIDAASYRTFIRDNDIKKGIIVADKGFPPSCIKDELEHRPELHFLTTIKRNDTRITQNQMLDFDHVLSGISEDVVSKKSRIKGGRYLYSFRDARKAGAEDAAYLTRHKTDANFDMSVYRDKAKTFGVIVLESDLELTHEMAYSCYADRWQLELVFDSYKNDECLDKTGVQGDFSVYGMEFINFIATLATCRILKKARLAGLLNEMSYGEMMDDLSEAWRKTNAPIQPKSDDEYWVHTLRPAIEEMEKLGLSEPTIYHEKRKRGRPKKQIVEAKPKRPRGRPRKNPIAADTVNLS